MLKYATLILVLFACAWVVSGCKTAASDVTGAGFEILRPAPASRQFIIANDIEFARQVAAHNATCNAQPGCRK